jgi:hypothetical protein
MVAIRIAQSLGLSAHDAPPALERFLANTQEEGVSTIELPKRCLVRLLRRNHGSKHLECLLTWTPLTTGECSFLGTLSIMECGRGRQALILDGYIEIHDQQQLQDEQLARERAETTGHAVLEGIASALAAHNWHLAHSRRMANRRRQRFMTNASPMLHAARTNSAKMG